MKDWFEKLIADAVECDLIGNLATEESKRNTFRGLARNSFGRLPFS